MSKTHTHYREKDNFRNGQLVLVSDTPFYRTTPPFYLPTPSFLWENSEPSSPFWENFKSSTLFPPYILLQI